MNYNIKKSIVTISAIATTGLGVYAYLHSLNKDKVPLGSTLKLNETTSGLITGSTIIFSGVLLNNMNKPIINQLISLHPFVLTQNTDNNGMFVFGVTIMHSGKYIVYATTANIKSNDKLVIISKPQSSNNTTTKKVLTKTQKTAIANTTHSNKLVISGAPQSVIDKQLTIALTAQGVKNASKGYQGSGMYFIPSRGYAQHYIGSASNYKLIMKTAYNSNHPSKKVVKQINYNIYNFVNGWQGVGKYYATPSDLKGGYSGALGKSNSVPQLIKTKLSFYQHAQEYGMFFNDKTPYKNSKPQSSNNNKQGSNNTKSNYYKPLQTGWKGAGYYKAWFQASPVYISNKAQYNKYNY